MTIIGTRIIISIAVGISVRIIDNRIMRNTVIWCDRIRLFLPASLRAPKMYGLYLASAQGARRKCATRTDRRGGH